MWILFYQTPYDRVKYKTSETDQTFSMSYKKFLPYLWGNFFVKDRLRLIDAIDRFETILLDKDTGDWNILRPEINHKDYSFEQLWDLNRPPSKEEEKEKDALGKMVTTTKAAVGKSGREKATSFRDRFLKAPKKEKNRNTEL